MLLTIIGDVHGKIERYKEITDKCEFSICVGDFGFKKEWDYHRDSIGYPHWINPGNHDWNGAYQSLEINGEYCSTGNFKAFSKFGIFTVRGAESIDKYLRTEGINWFRNEELNYYEQLEAFDLYCEVKPKIVVSHDCPQSVIEQLFGYSEKSQTRMMLENMFQKHKPELWVFGHHHQSIETNILGTRFVCLNELETLTIET